MNAQNLLIIKAECLLETACLPLFRVGSRFNHADKPRRLNPWPFLVAMALALVVLSFHSTRVFKEPSPLGSLLLRPLHAISRDFRFSHNSGVTRVYQNEAGDLNHLIQPEGEFSNRGTKFS